MNGFQSHKGHGKSAAVDEERMVDSQLNGTSSEITCLLSAQIFNADEFAIYYQMSLISNIVPGALPGAKKEKNHIIVLQFPRTVCEIGRPRLEISRILPKRFRIVRCAIHSQSQRNRR